MSRAGPSAREGTLVPLWWSLATLPARAWLAALLVWHRPPPSVGVLHRLSRRPDRRGSQCGRR